jgi:hypothetical protein
VPGAPDAGGRAQLPIVPPSPAGTVPLTALGNPGGGSTVAVPLGN